MGIFRPPRRVVLQFNGQDYVLEEGDSLDLHYDLVATNSGPNNGIEKITGSFTIKMKPITVKRIYN